MKQRIFTVVMMAVMMTASVGLASCGGSDGDAPEKPVQPAQQTSLNGSWVNLDGTTKEVAMALTFDTGNSVVAFIEGAWFFCTVERTASRMTLSGTQIRMESYKDFGTFSAIDLGVKVTITMDYELQQGLLTVSNISMSPSMGIGLLPCYGLTFDRVYQGESIIVTP